MPFAYPSYLQFRKEETMAKTNKKKVISAAAIGTRINIAERRRCWRTNDDFYIFGITWRMLPILCPLERGHKRTSNAAHTPEAVFEMRHTAHSDLATRFASILRMEHSMKRYPGLRDDFAIIVVSLENVEETFQKRWDARFFRSAVS